MTFDLLAFFYLQRCLCNDVIKNHWYMYCRQDAGFDV